MDTHSTTVDQTISGHREQQMREARSEAFDYALRMVRCVAVEI